MKSDIATGKSSCDLDPLNLALELPPVLAERRSLALDLHRGPNPRPIESTLAETEAWQARPPDEPWLVWRGRRVAARLAAMPIDVVPGEPIVGLPLLRVPNEAEQRALEATGDALADMPRFPGGDAGHFHPDHAKLLRLGIGGILREIRHYRQSNGDAPDKRAFYDGCELALEGMANYCRRVAAVCADAGMTAEAARCRRLASEPPETFHDAVQLMFIACACLWFGDDKSLTGPGRCDRTLRPFYEADVAAGRLDWREALDLLSSLFIHFNRMLWPGSAVAVMVGGVDANGHDVTNELTYLALLARQVTRLVYPTVAIAWHPGMPPALMRFACRMLATGIGCPAFFNDPLIADNLRRHGVRAEDCHNYMNSTCVEIKPCGNANIWVTQPYFNLPEALRRTIADVVEAEEQVADFAAFERLVEQRIRGEIVAAAERLDDVWHRRGEAGCFPLASCVIDDCLARGVDFDQGGARYNWVENSFVGLANLADGLTAIRDLVFDGQACTLAQLHTALEADFEGHESLRQQLLNHTCYGNDDDRADSVAANWAERLIAMTDARSVGLHRYVPGFFCWVMHERLGSQTGATPEGRRAGLPFADGAGPSQGRERLGPTASVLSTTKWDHGPALGGVVYNAKFSRSIIQSPAGLAAMQAVIETYLRRGGFEIQINVVGNDELRAAQREPERYQDLIVRVAGYSDYFVHLNRKQQDEVIARTEHQLG